MWIEEERKREDGDSPTEKTTTAEGEARDVSEMDGMVFLRLSSPCVLSLLGLLSLACFVGCRVPPLGFGSRHDDSLLAFFV